MNHNNFRRGGRSPPPPLPPPPPPPPPPHPASYDYDNHGPRPMLDYAKFNTPYHMAPPPSHPQLPFDGPERHPHHHSGHPQPMEPPMHPHHQAPQPPQSFIDGPNNYPPNYNMRESHLYQRPPPPSNNHRPGQPYASNQATSTHPDQNSRSTSPPYKILCITNIDHKINDLHVKDALVNYFSRFGDISVSVCHDNGERLAYIYFRNSEDARVAREFRSRTLFFDRPLEIEPIYEPFQSAGSPERQMSPMMPPASLPMYSPRRRSMTPPGYPHEITGPVSYRRQGSSYHQPLNDLTPSSHGMHRGPTPPEYGPNSSANYPHGQTPPPMAPAPVPPYERKSHHSSYNLNYRSPHVASPYSSPPHEQYRSPYNYQVPYPDSGLPSHHHGPPQPPTSRGSERAHIQARSPPQELPPYPSHHTSSSRSSGYHLQGRHPPSGPQPRVHSRRSNYPSEPPPARFMSRDFRREKFGTDPYPNEQDDGRPSRVLLVNNIDATKTEKDLRETFEPFGIIEDMEVKNVASDVSSALIKFSSMDAAYKAKTATNGRHIGTLRCRIVYGKVTASRRLWIGGLSSTTTSLSLERDCNSYGNVVSMDYTSGRPYCYVEYETANQAQFAAHQLRTTLTPASERKIKIEFIDPDRSDKLLTRSSAKVRSSHDSNYELNSSPQSTSGLSIHKRSVSPNVNDIGGSKRLCQLGPSESPPIAANTFRQERLAAAAAAKARTSSTTSSLASQEIADKLRDVGEMNNNSDNDNQAARISRPDLDRGNVQEAPSVERLAQCSTIHDVVQCCNVSWPSELVLKDLNFPARCYMFSGQKQTIDKYLSRPKAGNGDASVPILQFTQRWRLHRQPQPTLEAFKRRMQTGSLLIICARQEVAMPSRKRSDDVPQDEGNLSRPVNETNASTTTTAPQQNGDSSIEAATGKAPSSLDGSTTTDLANTSNTTSTGGSSQIDTSKNVVGAPASKSAARLRILISYLEQKDAVGVISLNPIDNGSDQTSSTGTEATAAEAAPRLLYAFPPGDFALNLLKSKASNLEHEVSKGDEFLIGVITGGNVDGKL